MKKILFLILSLVLAIGLAIPATPVAANPGSMTYLGMNANVVPIGPFSYAEVRLAVYLALDRDTIATNLGGGVERKVVSIANPPVPSPNVNRGYNPALAMQLLEDAGYPMGFPITLTTTSSWVNLAAVIKSYLAAVGIDAQIVVMDQTAFMAKLQTRSLPFFLTSAGVNEAMPQELLGRLLLSNSAQNYTGYNNSDFDSLFGSGQYGQAENIAFDLASGGFAIVPLFWNTPYYTITVGAVDSSGPPPVSLTVPITWSKTGGMPPNLGGGITFFNVFQAGGNMTVTAPLAYGSNLKFYVFRQWYVGIPPSSLIPQPLDQQTVTFAADANKTARARYLQIPSLGSIYPLQPDINPVGISHTVWVNIGIPVAGIKVQFVISGPNAAASGFVDTDATGKATFTYAGSNDGMDVIWAYIDSNNNGQWDYTDSNGNGLFDAGEPCEPRTGNTTMKSWVENFLTGGGNIKEDKKVVWTFDGTVGVLPEGGVAGQFEIVNHITKVSYYLDQFVMLTFSGGETQSPMASTNTARFRGTGTGSDGSTVTLEVVIEDVAEPGAGQDKIAVVEIVSYPPPPAPPVTNPWIGDIPFSVPPPPPPPPTLVVIDGGNFQVHNME